MLNRRERIAQIRRSIAMSPSLPSNVVAELLDELEQLAGSLEAGCDDLERLAGELLELRRRLGRS